MQDFATKYPEKVRYLSVGKSFEKRDIPAIVISSWSTPNNTKKQAIWFNAGQHAREWIGIAAVLQIATNLITLTDDTTLDWLNKFEFHITPMQNPDGYEYSRLKNRFWRKNRSRNGDGSFGVDLNRNWDEHWGQTGGESYFCTNIANC